MPNHSRPRRVALTGSRTWTNARLIRDRLADLPAGSLVIHGDARGADTIAAHAALGLHLKTIPVIAKWREHGRRAGMIRNARMLDWKPDLVIAFRAEGKSHGTDGMLAMARSRNIPVEIWREDGSVSYHP